MIKKIKNKVKILLQKLILIALSKEIKRSHYKMERKLFRSIIKLTIKEEQNIKIIYQERDNIIDRKIRMHSKEKILKAKEEH